jgi:tetratricopeptide (TPR) repeat protein
VARSSHFEVYSQAAPNSATATLTRFEELRSFFDRNRVVQGGAGSDKRPPLRVIEFSSKKEYDEVKIHANADAFYTGTADRDYIVMPALETHEFGLAAHEYAHFVLHSGGFKLPSWLNEGLAELFSTVRITNRQCELGGPLPARVDTLRRHSWLPASVLLTANADSLLGHGRDTAAIFYAESWAVTDMLTSSPEYALRFADLVSLLNSGATSSQQAFERIYAKSADAILTDVRDWVGHARSSRRTLAALAPETFGMEAAPVSTVQARGMIADLLFAEGEWDRVEQMDKELMRESPRDPEILASLGAVALQKGNRRNAVEYWRQALHLGLKNASLCYRYAVLAEELGLSADEIDRALEEAISVQPNFDDARYKLALLKSNAGEYDAAVKLLQSMPTPSSQRAYSYWTALAYALSELDRRDEAEDAAKKAMSFARSSDERAQAAELAYVAKTDLTVQFARDRDGKLQLVTTRVPHGTTEFNPFVEAGDQIRTAAAKLREVQCSGGKLTGFLVDSAAGTLTLLVPDPMHVLMRNGPSEFYCGPQDARGVRVEYATTPKADIGLLRGMEFQ